MPENTPTTLRHWDTQSRLSLHEASALIAGIEPLREQIEDDNRYPVFKLALRQLKEDYAKELYRFKFAVMVYEKEGPEGPDADSFERHLRLRVGIRSVSLSDQIAYFIERNADCYAGWLDETMLNLELEKAPKFEREELARWVDERNWDSAYRFQKSQPSNETSRVTNPETLDHDSPTQSASDSQKQRGVNNRDALIAAMAIQAFRYDPSAQNSNTPAILARLFESYPEAESRLGTQTIRDILRNGVERLGKKPN